MDEYLKGIMERAPGDLSPHFKFDGAACSISISGPSLDDARQAIALEFAKDVDGKLRQALIELGWTPPKD